MPREPFHQDHVSRRTRSITRSAASPGLVSTHDTDSGAIDSAAAA